MSLKPQVAPDPAELAGPSGRGLQSVSEGVREPVRLSCSPPNTRSNIHSNSGLCWVLPEYPTSEYLQQCDFGRDNVAGITADAFAKGVLDSYENPRSGLTYLAKAARSDLTASAVGIREAQLGVPAFDGLEVGESTTAVLTSVFLDLNNFTRRSFWDPLDDVTQLAHAVISGFASVVTAVGGHVAGLRGDGLYAAFGPTSPPALSVVLALGAASFALNAVDQALNPALASRGIEPVQVRAGIDHGRVSGIRSGTVTTNEINVIGFSANFAAKCEKYAHAWEIVVGEGVETLIADKRLIREHESSPKEYSRGVTRRLYRFFDYSWRGTVGHVLSAMHELDGEPASALAIQGA